MLERLMAAPDQLQMPYTFPVLLFSTSHLDCFLFGQKTNIYEVSQCVTQKYNADVQAQSESQTHVSL